MKTFMRLSCRRFFLPLPIRPIHVNIHRINEKNTKTADIKHGEKILTEGEKIWVF